MGGDARVAAGPNGPNRGRRGWIAGTAARSQPRPNTARPTDDTTRAALAVDRQLPRDRKASAAGRRGRRRGGSTTGGRPAAKSRRRRCALTPRPWWSLVSIRKTPRPHDSGGGPAEGGRADGTELDRGRTGPVGATGGCFAGEACPEERAAGHEGEHVAPGLGDAHCDGLGQGVTGTFEKPDRPPDAADDVGGPVDRAPIDHQNLGDRAWGGRQHPVEAVPNAQPVVLGRDDDTDGRHRRQPPAEQDVTPRPGGVRPGGVRPGGVRREPEDVPSEADRQLPWFRRSRCTTQARQQSTSAMIGVSAGALELGPPAVPRRVLLNTAWTGVANVWAMVLALVTLPLLLSGLGTVAFGTWALLQTFSAITGWLSLVDVGVGTAATKSIAERASVDDERGVATTIASALACFGTLGMGCAVVLVLAGPALLPRLFNTPPGLVGDLRFARCPFPVQVVVELMIEGVESCLEGLQRVDVSRGVDAFRRTAVAGATSVVALAGGGLRGVAVAAWPPPPPACWGGSRCCPAACPDRNRSSRRSARFGLSCATGGRLPCSGRWVSSTALWTGSSWAPSSARAR